MITYMAYAITHVSASQMATISQRTEDGWIFNRVMFHPVAARWCNDANDRLRQTYADNGHFLTFPVQH